VKFAALQRVVCPGVSNCLGFLRSHGDLIISDGPRGLFAVTVPRLAFRKAGSSTRELASPSETIRLSPARRVTTSSACLGVSSLFATSAPGVHVRQGSQTLPSVRPRRFSRPRRFTPPSALRAYFIPLPRPGFRFRGFLPPIRSADSSPSRPSSPLAPSSYHLAMAPAPGTSTSRVCSD